jgi:structural maintenance of chromosome 1
MEKTDTDRNTAEQELKEATQSAEQAERRRQELDVEIEKINVTLREARDDRRKNKDEERLLQAITSLKRHFPGVHGRLVDLCRPTQRRFNLAVTVAAGKDMDAIVVDTKSTGIECIRYLREQRVGTATFLPLDSIFVPSRESSERIRATVAQDGRFRLAADVITCDDNMKKAILYAVGNTVVCDDLDSARQLCFGNNRRGGQGGEESKMKAVTLGGAVISKAGTMTGGVTNEDSDRAGRWDDQKIEQLREKKEKLESERVDLDKGSGAGRQSLGHSTRIEELRNIHQSLKNRSDYSKSDIEFTRQQLVEKKILLKSIERNMPKLEQSVADADQEVQRLDAASKQAIADVKAVEDAHLGPFREETGMKDLQAYEEAIRGSRDEFNKKKRTIVEHITHLEQQKNYETNRDLKAPIARLEKSVKDHKQKLKAANKSIKELEAKVEEAKAKLQEAEEKVEEDGEVEKKHEEEVKALQKEFSETQAERGRISKAVTAEEASLERLRGKLHETLQKARVEEVELPKVGDKEDAPRRKTRSGQRIGEESEGEEEQEESEESPRVLESQPASTQQSLQLTQYSQENNPKVIRDQNEAAEIDFSKMDSDLKQRLSDREERKVRKDFEDKLSKIEAEIEGMRPNMKVSNSMEPGPRLFHDRVHLPTSNTIFTTGTRRVHCYYRQVEGQWR